jgi:hypothetical protein
MGFMSGVITGVAAAAVAAAWYLSRSGERIRSQYRIEDRLAQLGDELDARTRDIQAALNAQLAELRGASDAEVSGSAAAAAAAEVAEPPTDDASTKRNRKAKATGTE